MYLVSNELSLFCKKKLAPKLKFSMQPSFTLLNSTISSPFYYYSPCQVTFSKKYFLLLTSRQGTVQSIIVVCEADTFSWYIFLYHIYSFFAITLVAVTVSITGELWCLEMQFFNVRNVDYITYLNINLRMHSHFIQKCILVKAPQQSPKS